MDYGFTHEGKVYTPNGTPDIDPATVAERNRAISVAALAHWETRPDRAIVYYEFPAEHLPLFGRPRPYRANFRPCLHTLINLAPGEAGDGLDHKAIVTLWTGEPLGRIVEARVYRHNFGGRLVSIRVKGNNGAEYYGRASWDGGNVIRLRKVKS